MSRTLTRDFYLEVAKGNIPGHTHVNKFGHNAAVATGPEDVWAGGGIYAFYPITAQAMEISSSEAEDNDATGTGAKTVMVFNSPIQGFYNALSGIITNFYYALNDLRDKKSKEQVTYRNPSVHS